MVQPMHKCHCGKMFMKYADYQEHKIRHIQKAAKRKALDEKSKQVKL